VGQAEQAEAVMAGVKITILLLLLEQPIQAVVAVALKTLLTLAALALSLFVMPILLMQPHQLQVLQQLQ
jgi:hypothetical protein